MSPPLARLVYVAAASSIVILAAQGQARASDRIGIYAWVARVTLEPSNAEPTRVRVEGAFAFGNRTFSGDDSYADRAAGSLYFVCPPADLTICRMEWNDLAAAVGSGKCAGFGKRYDGKRVIETLTVRPVDDRSTPPDDYPIQMGVIMMRVPAYAPGPDPEYREGAYVGPIICQMLMEMPPASIDAGDPAGEDAAPPAGVDAAPPASDAPVPRADGGSAVELSASNGCSLGLGAGGASGLLLGGLALMAARRRRRRR